MLIRRLCAQGYGTRHDIWPRPGADDCLKEPFMRNLALALGATVLVGAGVACGGGGGSKTSTPEDGSTFAPSTELAQTVISQQTVSALQTVKAGGLTPQPDGSVKNSQGTTIPSDVATKAAEAPSGPPPGGAPTTAP